MCKTRSIFLALILIYTACSYPRYVQKGPKIYIDKNYLSSKDTFTIDEFYFSATKKKTGLNQPYEDVRLKEKIEDVVRTSIEHTNIVIGTLEKKLKPRKMSAQKVKRKHLEKSFPCGACEGLVILPILDYHVGYEEREEAGGPVGFSSPTGEDIHMIRQEVIIAVYKNSELAFLNRAARVDEKIVPAGTPITHEFPQEVLDTLMHMALDPLLKQMDKER